MVECITLLVVVMEMQIPLRNPMNALRDGGRVIATLSQVCEAYSEVTAAGYPCGPRRLAPLLFSGYS